MLCPVFRAGDEKFYVNRSTAISINQWLSNRGIDWVKVPLDASYGLAKGILDRDLYRLGGFRTIVDSVYSIGLTRMPQQDTFTLGGALDVDMVGAPGLERRPTVHEWFFQKNTEVSLKRTEGLSVGHVRQVKLYVGGVYPQSDGTLVMADIHGSVPYAMGWGLSESPYSHTPVALTGQFRRGIPVCWDANYITPTTVIVVPNEWLDDPQYVQTLMNNSAVHPPRGTVSCDSCHETFEKVDDVNLVPRGGTYQSWYGLCETCYKERGWGRCMSCGRITVSTHEQHSVHGDLIIHGRTCNDCNRYVSGFTHRMREEDVTEYLLTDISVSHYTLLGRSNLVIPSRDEEHLGRWLNNARYDTSPIGFRNRLLQQKEK